MDEYLLLSLDYLASDYCYEREMQRALERHQSDEAHVIPIILRPSDWTNTPFAHIQCLPRDANPISKWPDDDDAFLEITKAIRHVVEQRKATPLDTPELPALARRAQPLPRPPWHLPDTTPGPVEARRCLRLSASSERF